MMNTKKSYFVALTLSALLIDNNQKGKGMNAIKKTNRIAFTLLLLAGASSAWAQEAHVECFCGAV